MLKICLQIQYSIPYTPIIKVKIKNKNIRNKIMNYNSVKLLFTDIK